jgi:hypothetical protein
VGFFFFFENLKILGIKEPWVSLISANTIPKRMDGFHEIKFRDQESFCGFFSFFENLKILRIKEPCWVSLIFPPKKP